MKALGSTFSDELRAAGLIGLPISWGTDGTINGLAELTPAQRITLDQVVAAHDPERQPPPRYILAEDLIRALSQLPTPARDALRLARRDRNDVSDMWSLMLSKGSVRIDRQGTTWPLAFALLDEVLRPVISASGMTQLATRFDQISSRTP